MLGVVLDSSSASRGSVEIQNKPDRVEALVSSIDMVLQSGVIQKTEVTIDSLAGCSSQSIKSVAGLACWRWLTLGTWRNRLRVLGSLMIRRLRQSVPRILRVRDGEKPVLAFTDGACEFLDDRSYEAAVGGILYSPILVFQSALVEEWMVASFLCGEDTSII